MTPTARTLAECRKRGWRAGVVEKRIRSFVTVDLFGFIDVVALDGHPGVLGIQTTTGAHAADRVRKIREECREDAAAWMAAGNRVSVWSWAKRGKAGKRKLWTLVEVALDDLLAQMPQMPETP